MPAAELIRASAAFTIAAAFWGWPAAAVTMCLCVGYQICEGLALMYHGTHVDKTDKTAGIDVFGIVAGFYQGMIVWGLVRVVAWVWRAI